MIHFNIAATHATDVLSQVKARGYIPISANDISANIASRRNKKFPLQLFSQEMFTLLDAGLNLVDAIVTLTG